MLSAWSKAVAAAGERAAVTRVGERTGQIGDWEAAVGDNNKRALIAGMVGAINPMPEEVPPAGEVAWPDGTTAYVPLLVGTGGHRAAIQTSTSASGDDCACSWSRRHDLTSGPIQTRRGPATAPIWEFTVQGTAVKVARVAIADPIAVAPDRSRLAAGLAVDWANGTVGGNELTVAFVGASEPGDRPCGEDYTAEAVESNLAVVVIVTRHPNAESFGRRARASGLGGARPPRWPPRSGSGPC